MPHNRPINIYLRLEKAKAKNAKFAAAQMREKMLGDWEPIHWHLDSVSETNDFWSASFTVVLRPEDAKMWGGDDESFSLQDAD